MNLITLIGAEKFELDNLVAGTQMKNDPKKRKRALTDKLAHATMLRDKWTNKKKGSDRWITMLFSLYDRQVKKIQAELDKL